MRLSEVLLPPIETVLRDICSDHCPTVPRSTEDERQVSAGWWWVIGRYDYPDRLTAAAGWRRMTREDRQRRDSRADFAPHQRFGQRAAGLRRTCSRYRRD